MARKQERKLTDSVMLELTKIDTALSIGSEFVGQIPEGQAKTALMNIIKEGRAAVDRANEYIANINNYVRAI